MTSLSRVSRFRPPTVIKPHGPISTDTLACWIKLVLASAGVNKNKFTTHSTRAAASLHLAQRNFSITDIVDEVGWKNKSKVL